MLLIILFLLTLLIATALLRAREHAVAPEPEDKATEPVVIDNESLLKHVLHEERQRAWMQLRRELVLRSGLPPRMMDEICNLAMQRIQKDEMGL